MAFGTYMVLAGFSLGLYGKFSMFSLGAMNWLFVKGMVGWLLQVMLPKIILLLLGSGETPLLDVVGIFLTVLGKIIWRYSNYVLIPWTCLCTGGFLVNTMKRVLFVQALSYDSSKHQLPLDLCSFSTVSSLDLAW